MLRLAPYMKAGFQGSVLYLGFGSIIHTIKDSDAQLIYLDALSYWANPGSVQDLYAYLLNKGYDDGFFKAIVDDIIKRNYVIPLSNYDKDNPFSRNHLFFNLSGGDPFYIQNKLKNSHVLILGCGGIGNLISVALATSGIGKLTLVDDDEIEQSNLTRQFLFTKKDIGAKKTLILKRELLERVDCILINTFEERASWELLDKISNIDLIVLSADSLDCLPLINKFCVKNKVPFINIGYVQDIAVWGPFYVPGETGCFYCQNIIANDENLSEDIVSQLQAINTNHQAPSNGGVNMLAASLGFLDILKFLGEFSTVHSKNKRIGLWTNNLNLEKQDCLYNIKCAICANI